MAGLLNAQPTQMQGGQQSQMNVSSDSLNDPLLKQVEDGIEKAVPPEHQKMYQSIMVAGMNVMFSKETSQLLDQQLAVSNDIVTNISDGIAKLIMIIFNESKQSVDDFAPAMGLASISLMAQALDYAEQAKGIKVDEQIIADCTKATMQKVLARFGIQQNQVDQVIAAGQQQNSAPPQS